MTEMRTKVNLIRRPVAVMVIAFLVPPVQFVESDCGLWYIDGFLWIILFFGTFEVFDDA